MLTSVCVCVYFSQTFCVQTFPLRLPLGQWRANIFSLFVLLPPSLHPVPPLHQPAGKTACHSAPAILCPYTIKAPPPFPPDCSVNEAFEWGLEGGSSSSSSLVVLERKGLRHIKTPHQRNGQRWCVSPCCVWEGDEKKVVCAAYHE